MSAEENELASLLANSPEPTRQNGANQDTPSTPAVASSNVDFSQWQVLSNGRFRPGAHTCKQLPSAVFRLGQDDFGPFLEKINLMSDDFIELPEQAHMRVLEGIRKFWRSRDRYERHGLLYKRGILLWGPPGGGKTVTVQLLMNEIVTKHDGIVLLAENPDLTVAVLRFFRRIELERPLIVVFEDVDETVGRYGEHSLLAVLDGEHQTSNVTYLATTNYPERLGARIINRPSRFDERVKIGMPSPEARLVYLKKAIREANVDIAKWCSDTEGLSIAHLRELVVAVLCLEQDYDSVLGRLHAMEIMPKPEDGIKTRPLGLLQAGQANMRASRA
jgi:ATPase family associated with various cellular activities (AAA)